MKELELVVLRRDLSECGLKSGDIGTIVHVYDSDRQYEVEFMTADGRTIAVLSLESSLLRPFDRDEILHSRKVVAK